ncbi:BURP domain-containing protein 3-like [Silene latifolia]|uniref:BURP domain-containing protein 3-like n=1 Tax=Silene latifolia TaxID=37657 RepID=UPI003D78A89D
MASPLLLALILISLAMMPTPNVAESPAEAYWKLKFGNETAMPKIVKDALVGSNGNANNVLNHIIQKGFTLSEELESSIRKVGSIQFYKEASLQTIHENQVTNMANPTKYPIYFLETDLIHPGKTLKLNFMKTEDNAKFLPIQVAKSIPFSSKKLPKILGIFAVKPNSTGAEIMEDTIKTCETKAMSQENKLCAVTLEDMVDHVTSHVGNKVSTLQGYVDRKIQNVHQIVNARKVESDVSMVCHKTGYPYAVFYCHNLKETVLYKVSMIDLEGKKMDAVSVCHKDTSSWNPKHVSFQLLKVKPGTVPVCHLLDERSIAYVRS